MSLRGSSCYDPEELWSESNPEEEEVSQRCSLQMIMVEKAWLWGQRPGFIVSLSPALWSAARKLQRTSSSPLQNTAVNKVLARVTMRTEDNVPTRQPFGGFSWYALVPITCQAPC